MIKTLPIPSNTMMTIECPHCGSPNTDDFTTGSVDADMRTLEAYRCLACKGLFRTLGAVMVVHA